MADVSGLMLVLIAFPVDGVARRFTASVSACAIFVK
jgi:hypothetical protein